MGENDREIGELIGRVEALENWQQRQNGALLRMADRLDRFQWWLVLVLGGLVVNLLMLAVK